MTCELCDLVFNRNIKTKFHFEDDNFIMVDCDHCKVPMLVYKKHTPELPKELKKEVHSLFLKYATVVHIRKWYHTAAVKNLYPPVYTHFPQVLSYQVYTQSF